MKTTIGFTGDIAFSEYTKDIYKHPEEMDNKIFEFLNSNEYNVLNLESPVTESFLTKKAALTHKSPEAALDFIKDSFNKPVLSLANNHMMDFGARGLLETIENVNQRELPFIGAGLNRYDATRYVILGDEVKVGIIAAQYKKYLVAGKTTPGTAHNRHFELIKRKVQHLRNECDWVVMVYHGGEEFVNVPMPYTRKMYKEILDWGVDVIVAHHPHTVQGYEERNGKTIFYSLGNFIFDTDFQRAQDGTDEGVLISLTFDKDSYSWDKLFLKRNREENRLETTDTNDHFVDVNINYKENMMDEVRRMKEIRSKVKALRRYRNKYVTSNLHLEKAELGDNIPFDELVEKYYFNGVEKRVVFKKRKTNIVNRKFKKLNKKLNKFKNPKQRLKWVTKMSDKLHRHGDQ